MHKTFPPGTQSSKKGLIARKGASEERGLGGFTGKKFCQQSFVRQSGKSISHTCNRQEHRFFVKNSLKPLS